jgi:succinate dehydrogenase/fumarate reductase flavoprotein subunit
MTGQLSLTEEMQEEREDVQYVKEDQRGQERRGADVCRTPQPLEIEHGKALKMTCRVPKQHRHRHRHRGNDRWRPTFASRSVLHHASSAASNILFRARTPGRLRV